MIDRNVEK